MDEKVLEKLKILAESAKYDVSCASSGTSRSHKSGAIGSAAGWGICHSFAEDGRCISLLKIMLTNYCMYDCAYCINRRSNDLPRATLSVTELVNLTIEFYRRNYIEGLFLSSGVVRNPDYTMERLVRAIKDLRLVHHFNGYIHMKSIPGASQELVNEAGLYADRLSVNIEIPNEASLRTLAPEKDFKSVFAPMRYIQQGVLQSAEERKRFRYAPRFAPAGQSTQMIVGATADTDKDILRLSSALYQRPTMKRVYYSGFIPVNAYDNRLPALTTPPLVRENRLYQADWLLRFYQFKVDEIVDDSYPDLDLEIDPKLSWALRHPEQFPVDINKADYEMLLRVPGVGVKSAKLIVASRRFSRLGFYELKKILKELDRSGTRFEILYLESSDDVLIKRYKETRRFHPLSGKDGRVEEGIKEERKRLKFLRERADYLIDSSHMLTRELRAELSKIFVENKEYKNLYISVLSFGFKYGIPADADLVFDVRFLPNPYYIDELRPKSGNDKEVREYVMDNDKARMFLAKLTDMVEFLIPNYVQEGKTQLVIGIGCTGGKHRSVTLANELYEALSKNDNYGIRIEHRDIGKDAVTKAR